MRAAVLILAALAIAKVWAHYEFHRAATEEAMIAVFHDRAIAACQSASRVPAEAGGREEKRGRTIAAAVADPGPWAKPGAIRLVIGRTGLNVAIWDIDNALWPVRFKYPYLVLSPADAKARERCEFDVTLNQASLVRG